MTSKLAIEVHLHGPSGSLQLSVSRRDENGTGDGYRLAGPAFSGTAELLLSRTLDKDDAAEIRRYLDAVFPVAKAADPLTGLREEVQRLRTAADEYAADLMDEGKDAERAYGRVEAYDRILALVNHLAEG